MEANTASTTETGPGRGLQVALVAAVVVPLIALRAYQMLSLAALLYNPEYLYFGALMLDVHGGEGIAPYLSRAGVASLAYGPQQQGPMAIALVSTLISAITGPSTWALMATTVLGEALAVGLLVLVLVRACGPWGAVVGALPWILAPGPAVMRHLTPFGNHSEFMAVPLAVALFLVAREPEERPWWHWLVPLGVLAAGVFLYRLNVTAAVALVGAAALTRRPRVVGLGAACAAGGVLLAMVGVMLLHGGGVIGAIPGGEGSALPPVTGAPGLVLRSLWVIPTIFPAAPASMGVRWPYLLLLAAGLVAGVVVSAVTARRTEPRHVVLWFAAIWATVTLALGLLDGNPRPFHHINALSAVFVVVALLQSPARGPWIRRGAAAALVLLAGLGAVDNLALCDRTEAASNLDYDGLDLVHRTHLQDLDSDDLDYLERMIREGRGDAFTEELAWLTRLECDCTDLHDWVAGPVADLDWGCCHCWSRGELARRILESGDAASRVDMDQLGRYAWVACNRDMPGVQRTLEGLPPVPFDEIMAGARDEAACQSVP